MTTSTPSMARSSGMASARRTASRPVSSAVCLTHRSKAGTARVSRRRLNGSAARAMTAASLENWRPRPIGGEGTRRSPYVKNVSTFALPTVTGSTTSKRRGSTASVSVCDTSLTLVCRRICGRNSASNSGTSASGTSMTSPSRSGWSRACGGSWNGTSLRLPRSRMATPWAGSPTSVAVPNSGSRSTPTTSAVRTSPPSRRWTPRLTSAGSARVTPSPGVAASISVTPASVSSASACQTPGPSSSR